MLDERLLYFWICSAWSFAKYRNNFVNLQDIINRTTLQNHVLYPSLLWLYKFINQNERNPFIYFVDFWPVNYLIYSIIQIYLFNFSVSYAFSIQSCCQPIPLFNLHYNRTRNHFDKLYNNTQSQFIFINFITRKCKMNLKTSSSHKFNDIVK